MTSLLLLQENRSSPPSKRLGVPLRRRRDASVFYWPFFSRKMKTHTATFFVLMMINFCGPPSSLPFGPKGKWTAKASWQQSVSVSPLLFEKPPERTAVFFQPNIELSSTSVHITQTPVNQPSWEAAPCCVGVAIVVGRMMMMMWRKIVPMPKNRRASAWRSATVRAFYWYFFSKTSV